ncbi:MAG: ABC transporter permease [Gaiellales bacterium]
MVSAAHTSDIPSGYWRLTFQRLRRDRLAVASAAVVLAVFLTCFVVGPLLTMMLGHGPDTIFPSAVRGYQPVGVWTWVPNVDASGNAHGTGSTLFILGADGTVGRDEFMRLAYGGQVTIEVAAFATLIAVGVGVTVGGAAGYLGGRVDGVVVWCVDFVMAFPVLLMAIALGTTVSDHFAGYTGLGLFQPGVISISVFLALFTWPYIARLSRVQILELRERQFVEAARMVGAGSFRIVRVHIIPHVVPVLIPPATVMFAGAMLLQASLSILGIGIDPNTPSWGGLLAQKVGWLTALAFGENISLTDPLLLFPTSAILITVVGVAILGEQVRKALDPTGN